MQPSDDDLRALFRLRQHRDEVRAPEFDADWRVACDLLGWRFRPRPGATSVLLVCAALATGVLALLRSPAERPFVIAGDPSPAPATRAAEPAPTLEPAPVPEPIPRGDAAAVTPRPRGRAAPARRVVNSRRTRATAPASAIAVTWRAPTDALLAWSRSEVLTAPPRLGESIIPIDVLALEASGEKAK